MHGVDVRRLYAQSRANSETLDLITRTSLSHGEQRFTARKPSSSSSHETERKTDPLILSSVLTPEIAAKPEIYRFTDKDPVAVFAFYSHWALI